MTISYSVYANKPKTLLLDQINGASCTIFILLHLHKAVDSNGLDAYQWP